VQELRQQVHAGEVDLLNLSGIDEEVAHALGKCSLECGGEAGNDVGVDTAREDDLMGVREIRDRSRLFQSGTERRSYAEVGNVVGVLARSHAMS